MSTEVTTPAERVAELTTRLARAAQQRLEIERRRLAELERESRQLHDDLALMERSRGRRLFLHVRGRIVRAALAVRHPLWTAGSAARRIANVPVARTGVRAFQHLTGRSFPLRLTSPLAQHAAHPDDFQAIRWIGPLTIRHTEYEALLCHPDASLEYRVSAPSGSCFRTAVAISPNAWQHRPAAVRFRIVLDVPSASWHATREIVIEPGRRYTDRRWHPVSIPLPRSADAASVDVAVRLETSVAAGRSTANAWAVFADPRFEWRRAAADVRRSAVTFVTRVRHEGPRGAVALLRGAPAAEQETAQYAAWISTHTRSAAAREALAAEVAALPDQPLISIITPVYNTDPRWLRACVESVRRQVYPRWELCLCDDASTSPETIAALAALEGDEQIRITRLPVNGGISEASNAALALARGEFVALLDHDDELTPDALAELVRWINAHPDADVLYSDEDKLDPAGRRCEPCFKPDWSPEHFLHRMYTCHLFAARRSLVQDVGGFRRGYEGAQDYDLMLRLMERTKRVDHVPAVLYHWRKLPGSTASAGLAKPWAQDAGRLALGDYVRRNQLAAEVLPAGAPGLFRVKRRIAGRPLVSLIVPTSGQLRDTGRERVDLLARAIRSVVSRTTWPEYEFIIVADEAGVLPSAAEALAGTRHQVLRQADPRPFNFSRKVNAGVLASHGSHVLLFNDDIEAIDPEWMTSMLEYSQDPAIGAVGAKLLYPDGRLQHVGMLLGVAGIAAHAYHQHSGSTHGYFGCVIGPRNVSAVTGACLMTRREIFNEVGGFDEAFPTDFNDVDYCLRVRQAGYRIVYTPYAQLYHHESASFGARQQDPLGAEEMRRRWGRVLEKDPYYNPNLTRDYPDYRLR